MGRSSSIKKFSSLTDNESYHGEHTDLYYYCVYIGKASLIVDPMDSVWYVQDGFVASHRGGEVHSKKSGVTEHLAEDDKHALQIARNIVSTFNKKKHFLANEIDTKKENYYEYKIIN